jgi:hypothetical protein
MYVNRGLLFFDSGVTLVNYLLIVVMFCVG